MFVTKLLLNAMKKYYGYQWEPETVWLPTLLMISSVVFCRRKKLIELWNNLRVNKWQDCHFWVHWPFKDDNPGKENQLQKKSKICFIFVKTAI